MNVSTVLMMDRLGVHPVLAVILGIMLTTAIGFFNGYTISKTGIPPLIATLAMMTALRGVSFILTGGFPVHGVPDYLKFIGQGSVFNYIPVPGLIMVAVIVFGIILLNKTYLGRHFYALGSNPEATRLAGINVHFTRIASYTLLGFLTGIAGTIMMTRVASGQPNIADGFEMNVLTAAVLGGVSVKGGKGTIMGAFIGAVIIGVLNNGMAIAGASSYWQRVITGMVLFAVVVFDSLSKKRKNA
jgi:ribose/xylose/arabinose/galactoside ABC-type transport system permease subunit